MLLSPTSKKVKTANVVVNTTAAHEIIWEPVTPIFLPKKPEAIDPNSGKIIIARYII